MIKNSASLKLITLLLLLISTLPLGITISISVLSKLQNDAKAVNTIGYIRGSSQRLLISPSFEHQQKIIDIVDSKFEEIEKKYIPKNKSYIDASDFTADYQSLRSYWDRLKNNVLKGDISQRELRFISEQCWIRADAVANTAEKISRIKYEESELIFLGIGSFILMLLVISIVLIYTEVKNKLALNVIQDSLTKLYNRTYFLKKLQSSIKSFERTKHPFSLLFIDIDHFKSINDNFGHSIGDDILRGFADLLRETLREGDIAFRYGGEEFVVLAKHADISASYALAERIRKKVESYPFNAQFSVTISLGVSEFKEGDTVDDIINHADDMMYQAKSQGRNRTCIYHSINSQNS